MLCCRPGRGRVTILGEKRRLTTLAPAARAAVVADGYLDGLGDHFADPDFDFFFAVDRNADRVRPGARLRDTLAARDGDFDLSGLGDAYRVGYLAGFLLQFVVATSHGAGAEFRFVTAGLDHLGPCFRLTYRDGVFAKWRFVCLRRFTRLVGG